LQSIVEKVVYRENADNPEQTIAERHAWIDSHVFGLSRPIQAFGLERFKKNCSKAELGFQFVLNTLYPGRMPTFSAPKHFDLMEQRDKLKESAKRATELAKSKARPVVAACQPEL
jgi:hypothetical protein